MITRNYKRLAASILQSSSSLYAHLPVNVAGGKQYYLMEQYPEFPYKRTETFSTSPTTAGIVLGRGTTEPKVTDNTLEDMITSGINVTVTSKSVGIEGVDTPYVRYNLTVTNQTGSTLTIAEAGYQQTISVGIGPGSTSATTAVFLLDRTLLDEPLTLANGDAGVIQYTLKTKYSPEEKTVKGVKIVDWYFGSDEDVAAMIDAARAGTIDLQEDGGWAVGDTRLIDVAEFTGGNSKKCAAQKIPIAISQFGDYNDCGAVMQFDFAASLSATFRMNASGTNAGGYGESEMYKTTIPALAAALPTWLRGRLKEFDVLSSAGSSSSEIKTVTGNRLALRSEVEITGANAGSYAGEGSQIQFYKQTASRIKTIGAAGSADFWWLRSPSSGNGSGFRAIYSNGAPNGTNAGSAYGVAPFGCL